MTLSEIDPVTLDDVVICWVKQTPLFYSNDTLQQNCYDSCPQECHTIDYSLETSSATYPTSYYTRFIQEYFKVVGNAEFENLTDR